MMIRAKLFVFSFLSSACILLITDCGENGDSIGVQDLPPTSDKSALFVDVGGQGNGSVENPFGSIQDALDSAGSDSSVERIYIACGKYYESAVVRSGVLVYGGRDPERSWELSSSDSTVIMGQTIDGHSIGLAIPGTNEFVLLSHLTIMSKNAEDSDGSSYGIYCRDVDDVKIMNCRILAGRGVAGKSGQDGQPGEDGEDGSWWDFGGHPVPGGAGGAGGDCPGPESGADGDSGASYLDSPPGGAGGAGGGAQCCEGEAGQNGGDGFHGDHGAGADFEFFLEHEGDWILASTSSGQDGNQGGFGSGGGGGGGVGTNWGITGCFDGSGGSGGGAGAGPGQGGQGGGPGGSSIAILSIRSGLLISGSSIHTSSGGTGGKGGLGGSGGQGGQGGPPDCLTYCAGAGGNGGNGGDGGHGGGGCGGSSIGLLKNESSVDLQEDNSWQIGPAGDGGDAGGPGAGRGDHGIARLVREILIESASNRYNNSTEY